MIRLALLAVLAAALSMSPGVSYAASPGVVGTEGNLSREAEPRADGIRHTDTKAMISALTSLNANTYVYPMAGDNVQWEDLREEFLSAAAKAGIDVWVMVYAPSQSTCCVSRPYRHDYVTWAREIATLSRSHPNLKGWTVDDFALDLATFTPAYVGQMQAAARAVNPALKFVPTVYYSQFTDAFITQHVPLLDGVIFPYRDSPHRDTSWTWNLSYEIDRLAERLPGTDIYVMPYAHPLSHAAQKPTVAYVETVTRTAMRHLREGDIAGIIQYKLPLLEREAQWTRPATDNLARTGDGRLSFVVQDRTVTKAGTWCGAIRTVRPASGATRYTVSFWHRDNRGSSSPAGYHKKQLLLNDRLVWQQDVTADPDGEWRKATVDLTSKLAGATSARLQWRLYELKGVSNYFVDVSVDDIALTGLQMSDPGVEDAGTWTPGLSRKGGPVYCSPQVYHQNYGADLGARIARWYAGG
ncbi:hypothetical protein FH608_030585 [Nonomuraea phyllanthi]|uniref:DUF4434 domain-containing protein n=1 Tax=Nonomuraea phyllanthi TaxID=2219224 RepID=A0A5C4W239_9ACTN|nr:hypothetical protein [Nonomuraea phyllanthi]KAB8191598.1 hypothetical protein FH608_030585 [Nonomuraea phyllanthi]